MQAAGLLNHYECWGIDLEGQGDSPEADDCDVNMLQRHADDLLAVIHQFGCKGAPPEFAFPHARTAPCFPRNTPCCAPTAAAGPCLRRT